MKESFPDLMAAVALVRLLSAVHPLVPVQVVALDEAHVTRITGKWLLSWVTITFIDSFQAVCIHKMSVV